MTNRVETEGQGERLERTRRRQKIAILGTVFVVGLVAGILAGHRTAEAMFAGGEGTWPKPMAIGIVLSYLVAIIVGGVMLSRRTDEFERLQQYKAAAFAALSYMIVYPVWFALWMGDLVREPMHGPIFILFWISLAGASLYYRNR